MNSVSENQGIALTPREAEVIILKGIINNRERREKLIDLISNGKISEELEPLFIAVLLILENKDKMEPSDLLETIPDEELATALFENLPTDEETDAAEEVFRGINPSSKNTDQAILKIATWKRAIDSLSDKLGEGEITPETWIERVLNLLPSPSREKEKELKEALEQREAEIEVIKKDRDNIKAEAEKSKGQKEEIKSLESAMRLKEAAITSLNSQVEDLKIKLEKEKIRAEEAEAKSNGDSGADDKIKQLEKDGEYLMSELESKEAEISRLTEEIQSKDEQNAHEVSRLNEEIKAMAGEADAEIGRLNLEMKAMAEEADAEINRLNLEMKAMAEKAVEDIDEGKSKEIKKLSEEVEAISAQKNEEISLLNAEIEELKSKIRQQEANQEPLANESGLNHEAMESLKKQASETAERLTKEIEEKDALIQSLKGSLDSRAESVRTSMEDGQEDLRKELEQLRKAKDEEIAEKEEKLVSIKTKAKALLQKTKEREAMYEASRQENEALAKEIENIKEQLAVEAQKRKICENEKKKIEKELAELHNENKLLKEAGGDGLMSSADAIAARDETIAALREELDRTSSGSPSESVKSNHPKEDMESARAAVSEDTWQSVLENIQSGLPAVYMPMSTGFDPINSATGGIGGLSVICGGPKKGKTSLALQLAADAMLRNSDICCLYYTTDALPEALYCRMISQISGLNASLLHSGRTENLDAQSKELLSHACGRIDRCRNRFAIVGIENLALNFEYFKLQAGALMEKNECDRGLLVIDSLPAFIEAAAGRNGITPAEALSELRKLINLYGIAVLGTAYELSSGSKIMEEISYSADSIYEIISDREDKAGSEGIDLPIGITSRTSAPFRLATTFNTGICRFEVRNQRFKARKISPQEQKGPRIPDASYSQKKPSLF
ncbi:MAG: hypothetical protein MJ234_05025 [bacterium]|nr:hypothetical protein [bacterium]